MARKLIYGALVFFMVVMGFTACTEDDGLQNRQGQNSNGKVTLEMMPYVHSNLPEICVQTRADEGMTKDDKVYKRLQAAIPSTIGVFLIPKDADGKYTTPDPLTRFTYDYVDSEQKIAKWTSSVHIAPKTDYKVFGFMPEGIAKDKSIEPGTTEGTFVLTLENMDVVANSDVCAIVGVHDAYMGANTEDTSGKDATEGPYHNVPYGYVETTKPDGDLTQSDIKLGEFDYHAWEVPELAGTTADAALKEKLTPKYGVFLLVDHLFSCVNFEFKVSGEKENGVCYNDLRYIEITKLDVISTTSQYINATVTLKPNSEDKNPIEKIEYSQYGSTGSASPRTVTIYPNTNIESPNTILTTDASDVQLPGFFAPAASTSTMNGHYSIETTYNVYDKKMDITDYKAKLKAVKDATTDEAREVAQTELTEYASQYLVRGGCKSTNQLKFPAEWGSLERGTRYTFVATVEPTYLYQLSDHDLDNLKITWTAEP